MTARANAGVFWAAAIFVLAGDGALAQRAPGSGVVHPPVVSDEVDLVAGFRTRQEAGRHALDEAWRIGEDTSSRADRRVEQEFGGVIFETSLDGYGYTSPRSDAGWAGTPRSDAGWAGTPSSNAAREVHIYRGVAPVDGSDPRLYTPGRQRVVGTYHIHPEEPFDGRGGLEIEDWDFSPMDRAEHAREIARGVTDHFVRGPAGSAWVDEDGVVLPLSEMPSDTEHLPPVEPVRTPMTCGPFAECDSGFDEVACARDRGRLVCTTTTKKPCISAHRLPAALLGRGQCRAAVDALRTGARMPQPQPASPPAGGGGLLDGIGGALDTIGDTLGAIASGAPAPSPPRSPQQAAADMCGLDRPICD